MLLFCLHLSEQENIDYHQFTQDRSGPILLLFLVELAKSNPYYSYSWKQFFMFQAHFFIFENIHSITQIMILDLVPWDTQERPISWVSPSALISSSHSFFTNTYLNIICLFLQFRPLACGRWWQKLDWECW